MKTGGLSETKENTEEIKTLVKSLSIEILKKLNLDINSIVEVHSYKSQIVAGIIYFLKLKIDNNFYHAKVIDYLPHESKAPQILSIQGEQSETSEIIYF